MAGGDARLCCCPHRGATQHRRRVRRRAAMAGELAERNARPARLNRPLLAIPRRGASAAARRSPTVGSSSSAIRPRTGLLPVTIIGVRRAEIRSQVPPAVPPIARCSPRRQEGGNDSSPPASAELGRPRLDPADDLPVELNGVGSGGRGSPWNQQAVERPPVLDRRARGSPRPQLTSAYARYRLAASSRSHLSIRWRVERR